MSFILEVPNNKIEVEVKEIKKIVVLAVEIIDNGVGRAYAEMINSASLKELGAFLEKYVFKEATIITDEWRGYLDEYHNRYKRM